MDQQRPPPQPPTPQFPPPPQPPPQFPPPPQFAPSQQPVTWLPPAEQPGPAPGVQFAPHGERLAAYLIDSLIVTAILFVTIFVVLFALVLPGVRAGDGNAMALPMVVLMLVALVLGFGYYPFFWVRGGQTLGMKIFGLYVVRDSDGGPVGVGQAILRLVGYWIDALVFYLGFIWVLIDQRRRGWHDLIAGTVVIKR